MNDRACRSPSEVEADEKPKADIGAIGQEVFEHGYWHACSGCHESDEGHPTGPWSASLRCNLGIGCCECGGIGAVWEQTMEQESDDESLSAELVRLSESIRTCHRVALDTGNDELVTILFVMAEKVGIAIAKALREETK